MLDPDTAAVDAPVAFPNFPGLFHPDQPVAARELLDRLDNVDTIEELKDLIEREQLPLKVKMVDEGSAPMPRAVTQLPSEDEVRRGAEPAPDAPMPEGEVLPAGTAAAELAAEEENGGEG